MRCSINTQEFMDILKNVQPFEDGNILINIQNNILSMNGEHIYIKNKYAKIQAIGNKQDILKLLVGAIEDGRTTLTIEKNKDGIKLYRTTKSKSIKANLIIKLSPIGGGNQSSKNSNGTGQNTNKNKQDKPKWVQF